MSTQAEDTAADPTLKALFWSVMKQTKGNLRIAELECDRERREEEAREKRRLSEHVPRDTDVQAGWGSLWDANA